ncbi:hypothetical protein [Arthrobacter oryzae]|uniref:hypothetical protein n=1 Tax=Arthrobacter oryzae TaxID=409290 RepID=UPI00273CE021|nr:hypothetical protein [Arthrobacter oryzae]WLQ07295.1 hypothetical protein Q8Z05_03845 [Arthrobacter oryzae]
MNQQSHGQHKAVHHPGQASEPAKSGKPAGADGSKSARSSLTATKNETVLGPFTVRDLTVMASTLILLVASLIPMFESRYNLWNLGSLFFLGLGVILPLIVTALFAARRLSPASKVRIGSLSIDQFASVVASFALGFFFLAAAEDFAPVMLVGLIGSVGLFVATVLARFIPFFAGDFLDRAEVPAHVVARESAAPFRKPSAPKEPKAAKEPGSSALAGWSKRLTPGGAGNASRGAAGAAATEAPHSATPYSATPYGTTQHAATPRGTTQGAAPQGGAPLGHAVPAAAAAATPGNASGNNAAAATAAAAVGAGAASRGTDASPPTQAADVVPSAAEATQAAAVPAAEATQAAAVPAAAGRGSASGPATGAEPAASAPAASASTASASAASPAATAPAATMLNPQVRSQEPIGATVDPSSRPEEHDEQPVHEAFWFAVAQPRTAVDERTGMPAFVIEPGGWVLALEDRGHEFLVQHTDGRVGVLRDLSNIERG